MGTAEKPEIVLPIVGILSRPPPPAELESLLAGILGPPTLHSPVWDFSATRYYEPEMGTDLKRWFLAFEPNHPGRLPLWKTATNEIEQHGLSPSGRHINLDPGYLTLGGLFLASTKPGVHRLYLRDGIYGEITLLYKRGAWMTLPWTFPEFRRDTYYAFLSSCREMLKRRLPLPRTW